MAPNGGDDKPKRNIITHEAGVEDDVIRSDNGKGDTFAALVQRRLNRRSFLKTGAAAGALALAGQSLGAAKPDLAISVPEANAGHAPSVGFSGSINFTPIPPQPSANQEVVVAQGHEAAPLLSWGDPVVDGAPEWDPENQSAQAQEQQFGYNCDYIAWMPMQFHSQSSQRGLLWVNHEYTNPELMFPGYDGDNPSEEQVDIEIAAHGGSITEVQRGSDGQMEVATSSPYNRRITGSTRMWVSGPAAGHPWLATSSDPDGEMVLGTLNNCAGGVTPWGTLLTCEENFHQYFAHTDALESDDPRSEVHERYGMPEGESQRKWERFHTRFDVEAEPNEAFRFGWVVEVDPYDPESAPIKRTALGRFRHEGATFGYSPSGRVVFYSGDDARFEYIYKYVSDEAQSPSTRGLDHSLLDEGVLYVAVLHEDGSGEWLPLVHGTDPLTEENGFESQGDVLIKTRLAGDLLGATKMDRPEDIQQNPINKKVYAALTKNGERDETDEANPRSPNPFGHIIEITEEDDDAASTTFTWDIFILCGDPEDESTYFAGFSKDVVSPISAPDNLNFDVNGNLWISTDGQPSALGFADALHVVPTSGPERGRLAQFFSVVDGAECASFDFTWDNRQLFVSVQHPGQGGTFEEPVSRWPNEGATARPTVVQIWSQDGGRVGDGMARYSPASRQSEE